MRLIPHRDLIVIGSGVGGLITSTLLSRAGFDALLIEKNAVCGGRMNSEYLYTRYLNSDSKNSNSSYRFDVGPSLLLLPDVYEETFQSLGVDMNDYIKLLKVEPLYRCYFEEDQAFADISNNSDKMQETLNSIESNGYRKYLEYMSIASDFLRFGLPVVIEEKWNQINMHHLFSFLLACLKIFPLISHENMLDKFFPASNKIKAMMSFQDLYIGLSPYQAPAVFSLLQALEFEKGIFYPRGGFQQISQALETIARRNGVEILTNCTLESVNINGGSDSNTGDSIGDDNMLKLHNISVKTLNTDTGVDEFQTLSANNFITNIDVPAFESKFIRGSNSASKMYSIDNVKSRDVGSSSNTVENVQYTDKRAANGKPSCSVISLHFALNQTLQCLTHHTLYLSKHYQDSWNAVENKHDNTGKVEFNDNAFNFYIHAPSRTDDTVCPVGHDAITILVPIPPITTTITTTSGALQHQQQQQFIDKVRKAVIDKLNEMENSYIRNKKKIDSYNNNIKGSEVKISPKQPTMVSTPFNIEDYIVAERIRGAYQWQQEFTLFRGSVFGLTHSLNQLAFLRPKIRHPYVSNLYRVGASVRPGNGVPLVMIGAKLTAQTVEKDNKNRKKLSRKD